MNWRKLGRLFVPEGQFPWMASHAANPFAEHLEGSLYRVYFSSRDASNRSHVCSCVIDLSQRAVLEVGSGPLVAPGQLGTFDDSGAAMGWLLDFKGYRLLYYLGWNLKVTVPWMNTIGLAVWNAKTDRFEKHGMAPVMDRSDVDPFSISYPCVLEFGRGLRMWYGSNLSWGAHEKDMAHVIKTAISKDGSHWTRSGNVAVGLEHKGEFALSRPCILTEGAGYRMWYSYRADRTGGAYRIGMAVSDNGEHWSRRDDEVGIDVSPHGWDSEMICYAHVFDHDGGRYMLYNGNGYGRSGFGLAVLD